MLHNVWDLESDPFGGWLSDRDTSLGGEIDRHLHRFPGDWTTEELFDRLGAFAASNRRFALLLEGLVSAETLPDEAAQRQVVSVLNSHLTGVGLQLRETSEADGYPVFRLTSTRAHGGRPKNFELFHEIHGERIYDLPALLPEVWLHWDPHTVKARGAKALLNLRMDFLMLLLGGHRIVLEVDGKHHYADGALAEPSVYVATMRGDRDLKLARCDVFRFRARTTPSSTTRPQRREAPPSLRAVGRFFVVLLLARQWRQCLPVACAGVCNRKVVAEDRRQYRRVLRLIDLPCVVDELRAGFAEIGGCRPGELVVHGLVGRLGELGIEAHAGECLAGCDTAVGLRGRRGGRSAARGRRTAGGQGERNRSQEKDELRCSSHRLTVSA